MNKHLFLPKNLLSLRLPRKWRRRLLRLMKCGRKIAIRSLLAYLTTKTFINSFIGFRPAILNINDMKTTTTMSTANRTNSTTTVGSAKVNAPKLDADRHLAILRSLDAIPKEGYHSSRQIKEIILHCSATKEGKDFSAADIRRWHLQRGFNDIGYHFVVKRDGTVEQGRDINRIGAHCLNHNRRSIGICYIGGLDSTGMPADTRTAPQRVALPALIRRLRRHHPTATIHGHREFAAKACPCFNAAEYASISPDD